MYGLNQQCLEWNTPLFIILMDFRKAFDSVNQNTLWKILHSYGIPSKIISIIKTFYEHFECSVIIGKLLLWVVFCAVRSETGVHNLPFPLPGRHRMDHNQHQSRQTQMHPVDSPSWKILTSLTILLSYQLTSTIYRVKLIGLTTLPDKLGSVSTLPKHKWCLSTPCPQHSSLLMRNHFFVEVCGRFHLSGQSHQ